MRDSLKNTINYVIAVITIFGFGAGSMSWLYEKSIIPNRIESTDVASHYRSKAETAVAAFKEIEDEKEELEEKFTEIKSLYSDENIKLNRKIESLERYTYELLSHKNTYEKMVHSGIRYLKASSKGEVDLSVDLLSSNAVIIDLVDVSKFELEYVEEIVEFFKDYKNSINFVCNQKMLIEDEFPEIMSSRGWGCDFSTLLSAVLVIHDDIQEMKYESSLK